MNRSVFLLLASLVVMLVGHGMQLSLLPLYARELGWSDWSVGVSGASYFIGFVSGCFFIPGFLNRAGFIRVFLCATVICAASLLVIASSESVLAWSALRFLTGLSLVAIYTTVEAWLNSHAQDNNRGRLMSVYVILTLLGIALGQQVLGFSHVDDRFMIAVALMLVSVIPVGLFATEEPLQTQSTGLKFSTIKSLPNLVIGAAFLSGIVTGLIWTMAPLVGESRGLSAQEIAMMMSALILGGVVFQYPLGYLSDRYPRKNVLALVAIVCAFISLVMMFDLSYYGFIFSMFVLGGSSLTLYALCAADANSVLTITKIETAGVLLFCHGVGSVISPLLFGALSPVLEHAMFAISALAMLCLTAMALLAKPAQLGDLVVLHQPTDHAPILEQAA